MGRFVFVIDPLPCGVPSHAAAVDAFSIDPSTGNLSLASVAPVGCPPLLGLPTLYGFSEALDPSGRFLYVTDSSNLNAFSVSPSGSLTPVPNSPYALSGVTSVAVDPKGRFVYATAGSATSVYSTDSGTGALTLMSTSPSQPGTHDVSSSLGIALSGSFLYEADTYSGVWAYAIDPNAGTLTPVPGSPFLPNFTFAQYGPGPSWLSAAPGGLTLYASYSEGSPIASFSIDSATGVLARATGSPFGAAMASADSTAVDPTGRFIYAAVPGVGTWGYSINAATAAPIALELSPFATGQLPLGIAAAMVNPSTAFGLTQVLPGNGGNAGLVTLQFFGTGLERGIQTKLSAPGQPDIVGSDTSFASSFFLTSTFDLTGAAPGPRDVVVTNPDGTSAALTGAFTVGQGGSANVWLDLLGMHVMRGGLTETYLVIVGNSGNVQSDGAITVFLSFPDFFSWRLGTSVPFSNTFQSGTNTVLALSVPFIPEGGTWSVPVMFTLPDDPQYAHQNYQISLWDNLP